MEYLYFYLNVSNLSQEQQVGASGGWPTVTEIDLIFLES